jgi:hypothetical protein
VVAQATLRSHSSAPEVTDRAADAALGAAGAALIAARAALIAARAALIAAGAALIWKLRELRDGDDHPDQHEHHDRALHPDPSRRHLPSA